MKCNHWLLNRLAEFNSKPAIIWKNQCMSFAGLVECIEQWLEKLAHQAIRPGDIVALCGDYSPTSCALLMALFINSNLVVPLGSITKNNFYKLMDIAQANWAIYLSEDEEFTIQKLNKSTTHPYLIRLQNENKPGLILFSSGSTGESKAMVLDVNQILQKFIILKRAYTTLVFLLIDHIGGINTLLHVLTQGGTLVTIQSRDAEAVCQAIETHKIELLPTTPTFLNMLIISGLSEQYNLSSLKLITYGTEMMPTGTLNKLNAMLPYVQLKQTYGLSELGILPTKSESNQSLWFQLGNDHVQYKIVDGLLWIKTKSSMLGYLNANNKMDDEGWFLTDDMVATKHENGKEYLRILGRSSEIINVGGEKVYPAEVENVLLDMANIADVVVTGKNNPITGQVVVAKINLQTAESLDILKNRIREYCRDLLEPYKIPVLIEIIPHNLYGARYKKIRREEVFS